jgi:hypothetical protein
LLCLSNIGFLEARNANNWVSEKLIFRGIEIASIKGESTRKEKKINYM